MTKFGINQLYRLFIKMHYSINLINIIYYIITIL